MVVDAERMRENLALTHGALFSQRALWARAQGGEADVVYVLRMQLKRMRECYDPFAPGVRRSRSRPPARLRPGQLLMDPGPSNAAGPVASLEQRQRAANGCL